MYELVLIKLYVSVFTLYEYKNKLDGGKSNTAITTIENPATRNFIRELLKKDIVKSRKM